MKNEKEATMENNQILRKDLSIIINLAVQIQLKEDLDIDDNIVQQETLEKAFKIKKLLTDIDNMTNTEIPF